MLRILPIRLLFPRPLALNLSRIADPQLQLQLLQQSFKPARMPTGFHAHTYLLTRSRESTIELLCLLWMGKPFLLELSSVLVQQCDLLKLGVVIDSYNDHCSAPFSRACWLALHHQLYSGLGADIVMESINVSDMDKAYAWLRQNRVEHASSGPQRLPDWNKNAAGIRAFYFRDPDGHPLEILQFPLDKGAAKWHQSSDKLFLGIDHTAIVVGDTSESLSFYRDLLGMRVAGESENYGTEQEHLNNVFGARLRITSLRASAGPGIELLEYVAPRNGKAFPPDEQANDVLHRQTEVVTPDAAAAAQKFIMSHAKFVSSGVVAESDGQLGSRKAFLVRDPDGHAILVEEK